MQYTSLVTGGAGFIGSHLVDQLIKLNHKVVVLDDLSGGCIENIHSNATFCKGSIVDSELVNALFEEFKFDYVYHLAAYAAEGLSHYIRRFNYQNNLIGSINLINASVNHAIKCFVFTSSIAVYGENKLPYKESQNPKPEDPYGIAKYAVEMDLKNAFIHFGLNSVIFRPHNVYGSRQNIGDKYRNVVGIFMNQILKKEALTIFGDGNQKRAFSHINDIAPILANSIHTTSAQNQIFNIGSDTAFTVNQLADEVMEAMDIKCEKKNLAARKEVINAYADHHKIESIFEIKENTSLKNGLIEMANWVKKEGAKTSAVFEAIEIEKNLPKSWQKIMLNEK